MNRGYLNNSAGARHRQALQVPWKWEGVTAVTFGVALRV
jgi:hypothetical protein